MSETNYSAVIEESSMELSARDKVKMKDTQNAVSILDFAKDARQNSYKAVIENVKGYVVLAIHNESSQDKDYKNFVIIDGEGNKYVTGSNSFWRSFKDIFDELKNEAEPWSVEVNLLPSKNYKDKDILTCSLV